MSYINQITVGGESYQLTPSFNVLLGAYLEPGAGAMAREGVYPLKVSPLGELYPNLAAVYNNKMYGIEVPGIGPVCGLGADMYGAIGVYVYTYGASPTIQDGDTKSQLGRLGLTDKGAIGVYTTGDDGIYTNEATKCISLKLKTDLVTLQSGERLGIYINKEGFLELIKV